MTDEKPKRERGSGSIFTMPGSKNLWIAYYANGKHQRESSGSDDPKVAEKLLKRRLAQALTKTLIDPRERKITVDELYSNLLTHYKVNNMAKALKGARERWEITPKDKKPEPRRLKKYFGGWNALNVRTKDLNAYAEKCREDGLSNATINRDFAALRRAYKLARAADEIQRVPVFPHFAESDPRSGFVEHADFDKMTADAGELWLRTFLELAFEYGWRKEELLGLRVRQVNFALGTIRLEPGTTKNKKGREVAFLPSTKLHELLTEAVRGKQPQDFVLTREGKKPIKDYRAAWQNLCVAAGLGRWLCLPCSRRGEEVPSPADGAKCEKCGAKARSHSRIYRGLIPHDMRRSSAKAARHAGIPESVVMARGGWKTNAMFRRYAIVSSADQRQAAEMFERARTEFRTELEKNADATPRKEENGKPQVRPN